MDEAGHPGVEPKALAIAMRSLPVSRSAWSRPSCSIGSEIQRDDRKHRKEPFFPEPRDQTGADGPAREQHVA